MKRPSRKQILKRIDEKLCSELKQPESWHYLSFASKGFLGVVVIKAHGVMDAVERCCVLNINPGGEVMCSPLSDEFMSQVPETDRTRLLSREDVQRIWPDAKTIREYREEEVTQMKPLVLYHANCWDGFCAAWIARKKLGEIEAVPVHYGTPMPDVSGRNVFILDFSYPKADLLAAKEKAMSLRVIDHHKTSEEELRGLIFCTFDQDKSGGRLTWEHFYGDRKSPWLVNYTEDRDLWRHKLPYSQEINATLRSHPLNFDLWDQFELRSPMTMVTEGEAIRRREKQIISEHVRNATMMEIGHWTVPAVNATVLFSEIAGELAKGNPFGACYFTRSDGKVQWSLRSEESGLDVSAIAKTFGGGGHKHAAGYETFSGAAVD